MADGSGGTKADAKKELTRLLAEADKGMLPQPTKATVASHGQQWLDTATGRSPKTLERYRELFTRQIKPHLGDKPLQKPSADDIKGWHASLAKQGLSDRHNRPCPSALAHERALEETTAQGLRLKPPKTKRSRRTVKLAEKTVTVLREYKIEQLQYRLAVGMSRIENTTLVFHNGNDAPLSPRMAARCSGEGPAARDVPRVAAYARVYPHQARRRHSDNQPPHWPQQAEHHA